MKSQALGVALGAILLYAGHARAAINCDCAATGPFVAPVVVDPSAGSNSPNHLFTLSVTGGDSHHTVAEIRVSTAAGTPRLVLTPAIDTTWPADSPWGFSPDDNRFVVHYQVIGTDYIELYDLTSATPSAPVQTLSLILAPGATVTSPSGSVGFSPNGDYMVATQLQSPALGSQTVFLNLASVAKGSLPKTFSWTPFAASTDDPDTTVGSASWGFSPDDQSFTYIALDATGVPTLSLLALPTATVVQQIPFTSTVASFVQFSPCGEALAFVDQISNPQNPTPSDPVTISAYSTTAADAHKAALPGSVSGLPVPNSGITLTAGTTNYTADSTDFGHSVTFGANSAVSSCGDPAARPTADNQTVTDPINQAKLITLTGTDPALRALSYVIDTFPLHGSLTPGPGASHTYAPATDFSGPDHFTFHVTANAASSAHATVNITVLPDTTPPHASFTFTPQSPVAHDKMVFTDTSFDNETHIVRREWSFGLAAPLAVDRVVSFTVCSDVVVSLTVYDVGGQSNRIQQTIPVGTSAVSEIPVHTGTSLTDAIASACPGDTLRLDAGTFDGGFILNGLSLKGAGAGQTIVNGKGSPDLQASGRLHGFVIVSSASTVFANSISDLTISGGGNAWDSANPGGGVWLTNPDNSDGFQPTQLTGVEVRDNTGWGGVEADHPLDMRNSKVVSNTGSAVVTQTSCGAVAIKDSEIAFNSCLDRGDCAAVDLGSEGTCGGVTFTGNYVHDNSTSGRVAALYLSASSALIANNRFVRNSTPAGACLWLKTSGDDPTWLFFGNLVANNVGGGIFDDSSGVALPNLDDAGDGGPVGGTDSLNTTLRIVNSTITGNSVYGLLTDKFEVGGGATIVNSIIGGNAVNVDAGADAAGAADITGKPGTVVHSLIGTLPAFQNDGSFQLASGSAAIDQGDNGSLPVAADFIAGLDRDYKAILTLDPDVATILAHDAAGHARVIDGDGNGVSTVDIGFSEFDPMLDGGAGRDAGAGDSSVDGGMSSVDASVGSADGGDRRADAGGSHVDSATADDGGDGSVAGDAGADLGATSGTGCGGCRVAARARRPLPLAGFVAFGACLFRRRRRRARSTTAGESAVDFCQVTARRRWRASSRSPASRSRSRGWTRPRRRARTLPTSCRVARRRPAREELGAEARRRDRRGAHG